MERINFSSINFSKLQRLQFEEGKNAKLYTNKHFKRELYKIYNQPNLTENIEKEKKLEIFSKVDGIDGLVKPIALIHDDSNHIGYTTKFIDSLKLSDMKIKDNDGEILSILVKASNDLKKMHNNKQNIIVGDLHFDNIIVDRKQNPHFIDIDSYGIGEYKPNNLPNTLYSYCDYMNYDIKYSKSMDRLSFMLNTFCFIFDKNFVNISLNEYDEKTYELPFLRNMRELFIDMKNSYSEAPDVGYLDDIIKVKKR